MGSEVRVVGSKPSPFVSRTMIALNLKGVEFEFLEEKFGSKSELLLKSNPVHKKMPVLLHNDKPVCESLVIVEYVDEVWSTSGVSLLPSDPYDRAIARFWASFVDEKFFPSLGGIRKARGKEEKDAAIQQVKEHLFLIEDAFVKTSKGKPFFSGEDHIGFLDIPFGSFLGWIGVAELINGKLFDEKTPNLALWAHRFMSDPAVKDSIPPLDDLLVYNKMFVAAVTAGRD